MLQSLRCCYLKISVNKHGFICIGTVSPREKMCTVVYLLSVNTSCYITPASHVCVLWSHSTSCRNSRADWHISVTWPRLCSVIEQNTECVLKAYDWLNWTFRESKEILITFQRSVLNRSFFLCMWKKTTFNHLIECCNRNHLWKKQEFKTSSRLYYHGFH